ncbi:MAG: 3-hydroxyacyl-CoA dehydrogenase [Eubacterium sp.]|jgi:3-hydroxybutyryl-CoA dehydrogenase|nr:3-hydroxyacyl-CoA dehydrogenase [Eubacterium sp.]MDD6686033.1 3-hydroxyacyl-CoA dehydrogenase [Lachnospiraceae bacterium]
MEFGKVVVVGGGVLGTQIALMSAYTGHDTTIWLRSEGSVGRTQPKIQHYEDAMLADLEAAKKLIGNPMGGFLYPRGLIAKWEGMTPEEIDRLAAQAKERFRSLLHISLNMAEALKGADVVIESMSENPQAKVEIYEKMRELLDENTLLLTNTSTLLPSMFAEHTGRPDRYLALHFANSIWKNNTAEVMGHAGTSPESYRKAVKFAQELQMVPLQLHKEQPGYILNSLLVPFLNAAEMLWAEGVSDPETIDKTWQLGTGAPVGPFKILDIVGLETAYNIVSLNPESKKEGSTMQRIASLLKEKIDKGEKGINAGKGFYTY